jgi:hypothetical protein
MKLKFSNEWLQQKIENEPEGLTVEAGALELTSDEFALLCENPPTYEALELEIKLLPKVCDYNTSIDKDVAKAEQIKSGNRIMWATTQRLSFPTVVYLVSVPRALNDGLEIPKDWIEINEREYTLAFHNHNTEVGRLNSETEDAA